MSLVYYKGLEEQGAQDIAGFNEVKKIIIVKVKA
jgi:hypothetical protein